MLSVPVNGSRAQLEINMTEAATKQPGKIKQPRSLWKKASDREFVPRPVSIELDGPEGINPWSACTRCA